MNVVASIRFDLHYFLKKLTSSHRLDSHYFFEKNECRRIDLIRIEKKVPSPITNPTRYFIVRQRISEFFWIFRLHRKKKPIYHQCKNWDFYRGQPKNVERGHFRILTVMSLQFHSLHFRPLKSTRASRPFNVQGGFSPTQISGRLTCSRRKDLSNLAKSTSARLKPLSRFVSQCWHFWQFHKIRQKSSFMEPSIHWLQPSQLYDNTS